jgi:peptide/nickel transport system permease protein
VSGQVAVGEPETQILGTAPMALGTTGLAPGGRRRRGGWLRSGTPAVWFAFGFLVLLIAAVVLAQWIPGLINPELQYGAFHQTPALSVSGLLGTDPLGRSIFSEVIYGGRVSLTIAFCATAISLAIGVSSGLLAGYYRGVIERVVDTYANTLASVPPLLWLLALVAATGASLFTMTLALGVLGTGMYARITKAAAVSGAERDYVLAARALGASDFRILIREILPNLVPVFTAIVPAMMAGLIVTEGSLSFLGYGIPPPTPSWGGMLASTSDVMQQFPYMLLGPILAIVLTVYALNTLGDHLAARISLREGQL